MSISGLNYNFNSLSSFENTLLFFFFKKSINYSFLVLQLIAEHFILLIHFKQKLLEIIH